MQILTADEMRATDRVTVERYGVASIDLMRHAGGAVARFVDREHAGCRRIGGGARLRHMPSGGHLR